MDEQIPELSHYQIEMIKSIMIRELLEIGTKHAIVINSRGDIIVDVDNDESVLDIYSLAILAANNFGILKALSSLIDIEQDPDDDSLLYLRGGDENMHFHRITDQFLLITIFSKEISVGFARERVAKTNDKIKDLINVKK